MTDRALQKSGQFLIPKCPAPFSYGNMYEIYRGRASAPPDFKPQLPLPDRVAKYTKTFEANVHLGGLQFFITHGGRIGPGPSLLRLGDLVVIICGADMPFILRNEANGSYILLGCPYVHGIMYGEYFSSGGSVDTRTFSLV
ncbi:hypothetical protein BDW02DRAFT_246055 [Decorospora gaudefroyi]|uniref:Uncharacterized protein n=1 Tax=Decorospora gaudefroyi TaxID=184978 RepID=A0A6A5KL31_9PLEO|nr:hypothetical protein BDW02DRAFT_246055 [Decorospora gaudefroyi]